MAIIEGTGLGHPLTSAGAPVAGTNAVQTITIGGTPEAGDTFTLTLDGWKTAAIAWSAVNATLVANIDAALEALPNIGTGGVVTAVGTATAGVGTFTVTFSGAQVARRVVSAMTGAITNADGDASVGTIGVAITTPGVAATGLGSGPGSQLVDTTNGVAYINTGTAAAPTWTKIGTQT